MDQKTYDKIKALVRQRLRAKYLRDEIEDCTQYIAMREFENPKVDWGQCCIDWCRMNGLGKRGNVSAIPFRRALFIDLGVEDLSDENRPLQDLSWFPFVEVDEKIYINQLTENLREREREIMQLIFIYDFNQKDIADYFGFSESRAVQKIRDIKLSLKGK